MTAIYSQPVKVGMKEMFIRTCLIYIWYIQDFYFLLVPFLSAWSTYTAGNHQRTQSYGINVETVSDEKNIKQIKKTW